jgi:quercetin dioxygenase-like cupin family protein
MTIRQKPESERPLHVALQTFDLQKTAQQLRNEPTWATGRNAITLRKARGLQVVLLAMQAGDRLHDHQAAGPITLHVISGKIRFTTADQQVELAPQMVVALDDKITHAVEALEEAVCLLTIGGTA